MNDNEPYIYYVKCKGHPNLAIQACSREEYRKVLEDYKRKYR